MQPGKLIRNLLIILIMASNIGCDQITKTMVREKINDNERIQIIDHHFTLTKIENSGAFLSLGDSLPDPIKFILLLVLPVVALAAGTYYLLAQADLPRLLTVGLCFVIGGGIGNLYDRILYGSVTDFLHINFVIFQTGIFNMADLSIMTGTFIILIQTYFKKENLPTANG